MTHSKGVTIITVTLNRPSLLNACTSVDNQTYPHWHHIILGDGILPAAYTEHAKRSILGFSTPIGASEPGANMHNGTPNPLLRWALKNLKLNDFVCFLDDDNQYLPSFLEKMVEALNQHPEAGLVLCGAEDLRYTQNIDGYPVLGHCDNSAFMARREAAQSIEFPYASLEKDVVQDFEYIKLCSDKFGWTHIDDKLLLVGTGMNPPPDRGQVLFLESWKLAQQASCQACDSKFELAEITFLNAISLYHDDAWSWKKLAEIYLIQQEYKKADYAFSQWLELYKRINPGHYASQYAYAQYLKHYHQPYKELMEASVLQRSALEGTALSAHEHTYYSLLSYIFLEDHENACLYLNKCKQIPPDCVRWAYLDAGWTLRAYHRDIHMDLTDFCQYFEVVLL